MKIISSDLQAMAVAPKGYPDDDLFEIAFAGRSNVGKSSLINAMLNRANLARTSGKPGKTRTINFYLINEKFRFVDLPGYGYAQVSKLERKKWGEIIERYLKKRGNLKAIVLIVDIRHAPTAQDIDMYRWIKAYGYDAIIAATKADKISKGQRQKYLNIVKKELGLKPEDKLIAFSSLNNTNRDELWELLEVYNLDSSEAVE
ncbi:MAG: YihA family ribosome biogenesis GTP-binding protein [Tissierellia bacterium]|nr:YihA family ribosome biogenesis GTP-binding protein [Tissierellia bacterium]